jgi:hypothetical protein
MEHLTVLNPWQPLHYLARISFWGTEVAFAFRVVSMPAWLFKAGSH